MKTIKELVNEKNMSVRLYNALIRNITWEIEYSEAVNLTVRDIFELWTEEEMLKWRAFGQKCLK